MDTFTLTVTDGGDSSVWCDFAFPDGREYRLDPDFAAGDPDELSASTSDFHADFGDGCDGSLDLNLRFPNGRSLYVNPEVLNGGKVIIKVDHGSVISEQESWD